MHNQIWDAKARNFVKPEEPKMATIDKIVVGVSLVGFAVAIGLIAFGG